MKNYVQSLLGIVLISLIGCFAEPANHTLDDLHKKFVKICKTEFDLDITVKHIENTLWVYVPVETPLFDYKAVKTDENKDVPKEFFNIRSLVAVYEDNVLVINYDITKEIFESDNVAENPGFADYKPEEFSRIYQNVFGTISRVYFSIDNDSTQTAGTNNIPEFFVVNIVDTNRGIVIEYVGCLCDFKRFAAQDMPEEEYLLRTFFKMHGDLDLVDNKTARKVEVKSVSWREFFRLQLLHRIRFKFLKSSHPPEGTVEDALIKIINEMNAAYPDHPFPNYQLNNKGDRALSLIRKGSVPF